MNRGLIMKNVIVFFLLLVIFTPCVIKGSDYFILGDDDNDPILIQPRYVQEGPDGNIYVYDRKDAFIKVFSKTGILMKKLAGLHEGPGFIKRADGVTFGFTQDKNLFFTEYFTGHRWITILNLDGRLKSTITPAIKDLLYGVEQAVSLPDGSFLVEIVFLGKEKKEGKYYLITFPSHIFHLNPKGEIISRIKNSEYFSRISYLQMGADMELPFIPLIRWCPFKKNILYTDGLSPILKIINYQGKTVGEIDTKIPIPADITSKDIAEWKEKIKNDFTENQRDREWYNKFGKVIEEYDKPIYPKKTCISDMSVTPGNNILLRLTSKVNKTENEFRLIDEKGKCLIVLICKARKMRIDKQFIFIEKHDEDGVNQVHCFKRKGTEVQDLKMCYEIMKNK